MKAASSNWGSLQSKLSKESKPVAARSSSSTNAPAFPREKRTDLNEACKGIVIPISRKETENKDDKKMAGENLSAKIKDKYVGLDCEMVGIGLSGKQSALARCCIVDFDGLVIYDKYVRPKGFVTDFRTQWSGIRKQDLRAGEAITLLECQENVTALLKDKILVGHALKNDLDVLMLGHPKKMIRDTATFKPYMRPHGRKGGKFKPRALKELSKQHLGLTIQTGEHDPGEDARCAMFLYRTKMKEWEDSMKAAKALQAAAFKRVPGVAQTSSVESSAATEVAFAPAISVRMMGKESGLSGKERRLLRRNGPSTPSKKKGEEGSSDARGAVPEISSSSNGRGGGGRGSGDVAGDERDSRGRGDDRDKEKKRKGSSSAAPSGMFHNDLTASTSISDIDRIMSSTSTAHTTHSAKKQRR